MQVTIRVWLMVASATLSEQVSRDVTLPFVGRVLCLTWPEGRRQEGKWRQGQLGWRVTKSEPGGGGGLSQVLGSRALGWSSEVLDDSFRGGRVAKESGSQLREMPATRRW